MKWNNKLHVIHTWHRCTICGKVYLDEPSSCYCQDCVDDNAIDPLEYTMLVEYGVVKQGHKETREIITTGLEPDEVWLNKSYQWWKKYNNIKGVNDE